MAHPRPFTLFTPAGRVECIYIAAKYLCLPIAWGRCGIPRLALTLRAARMQKGRRILLAGSIIMSPPLQSHWSKECLK